MKAGQVRLVIGCLLATGIVLLIGWLSFYALVDRTAPPIPLHTKSLSIRNQLFTVYTADSATERAKGLSGTRHLARDEGMIFTGHQAETLSLWMKDMYIPLDVIWVNRDNDIVHVVENITSESYPSTYQNPIDKPAAYVIELNAGTVARHGIQIGDKVVFRR